MTEPFPFTLSLYPEAESYLDAVMNRLKTDISASAHAKYIRSVVLGGGYGRGEGGVFRLPGGKFRLYNDLDFFVVSDFPKQRKLIDMELRSIADRYAEDLRIDVDFAPARSRASLKKVARTLMFQELIRGHRVIFGDESIFDSLPPPDFANVSESEGARLLMNRGAGLLLARKSLSGGSLEESDFIRRNCSKAVFGCGDAVLIFQHKYVPGYAERLNALKQIPGLPDALVPEYRSALEFKKYPEILPFAVTTKILPGVIDLWMQTVCFIFGLPQNASADDMYCAIMNCPATNEGSFLRNLLVNLISRLNKMPTGTLFSHPRRVLLAELPILFDSQNMEELYWIERWRRFN